MGTGKQVSGFVYYSYLDQHLKTEVLGQKEIVVLPSTDLLYIV